jgi:hypothetical protein
MDFAFGVKHVSFLFEKYLRAGVQVVYEARGWFFTHRQNRK